MLKLQRDVNAALTEGMGEPETQADIGWDRPFRRIFTPAKNEIQELIPALAGDRNGEVRRRTLQRSDNAMVYSDVRRL
jgi:hypothetical protein